jgi:hypothetical protein
MNQEVVLAPKLSKVEWDMSQLKLSHSGLISFYRDTEHKTEEEIARITDSHKRQKDTIYAYQRAFPDAAVLYGNDFPRLMPPKTTTIIALGGDNHGQGVARWVAQQLLVLVNTDPVLSHGGLLNRDINDAEKTREILEQNTYNESHWTRLQVELDGNKLPYPVLSEVFLGEYCRFAMTRDSLIYHDVEEREKGSGIIVCTGSGMGRGSWFYNATRKWDPKYFEGFPVVQRTDVKARFLMTEAAEGDFQDMGDIIDDESITIISSARQNGVIALDSDPFNPKYTFPFPSGSRAKISIDLDNPVRVMA